VNRLRLTKSHGQRTQTRACIDEGPPPNMPRMIAGDRFPPSWFAATGATSCGRLSPVSGPEACEVRSIDAEVRRVRLDALKFSLSANPRRVEKNNDDKRRPLNCPRELPE